MADTYRRIRFRKLRQIMTILAISGVAVAGLWWGYEYTQTKFYVGESNGHVTIYKGIRERLGPLGFSSVYSETDVLVDDLSEYHQGLLERTIYATDLADAYRIIDKLTSGDGNG
jgi:protein phosphatase